MWLNVALLFTKADYFSLHFAERFEPATLQTWDKLFTTVVPSRSY